MNHRTILPPIKVAIVDDHPMVRDGLICMLEQHDHMQVVGSYASGKYLLGEMKKIEPDVILLDFLMPDKSGEELLPEIKNKFPQVAILMVTSNANLYNIKTMLNIGANGYILKSADQELLIHAIEQVYAGDTFISPEVKNILSRITIKAKDNITLNNGLTPREIDILRLIAEEKNSHEIAGTLHLSYKTVENYRLGIMQKLDAKNMIGMVKKAILLGILHQ